MKGTLKQNSSNIDKTATKQIRSCTSTNLLICYIFVIPGRQGDIKFGSSDLQGAAAVASGTAVSFALAQSPDGRIQAS